VLKLYFWLHRDFCISSGKTMPGITLEAITFSLFGALGDLALRKLFPALYQLDRAGLLHADTRILALSREPGEPSLHKARIEQALHNRIPAGELDERTLQRFAARLEYLTMDFRQGEGYAALAECVPAELPLIAYFATPASVYGDICRFLAATGLAEQARVVLEKPIGHDLESSRVINDAVAQYFPESRIYRIDHYLGKETVQNLIALRFANSLFETQWDQHHISHVEITVAETVGIEGRWGYFDQAGQLRDMVQNHLLQLLCLIAMDPPSNLTADSIRDEKVKVLKALAPLTPESIHQRVVRGQYAAGNVAGKAVPGYLEEENSNTESSTETFVALRADICNWRWSGVPFYLRTGKRMAQKLSQIVIHFKEPPFDIFAPDQQPPDHSLAAGRRNLPTGDDQGAGPGQGDASSQRPSAAEFLRDLQERSNPGCLRAPAAGSHAGQPEPVRASGRDRVRLAMVRSVDRRLDPARCRTQTLPGRLLGAGRFDCPHHA